MEDTHDVVYECRAVGVPGAGIADGALNFESRGRDVLPSPYLLETAGAEDRGEQRAAADRGDSEGADDEREGRGGLHCWQTRPSILFSLWLSGLRLA